MTTFNRPGMIKTLLLGLFLSHYLLCVSQTGNHAVLVDKDLKRIPVKSGMITYELSGDVEGTEVYYFDEWGWLEKTIRKYTYSKYGISSDENRVELRNGDFEYRGNFKTGKGSMTEKKLESSMLRYKSSEEVNQTLLESRNGTVVGEENILGRLCTIWEFPRGLIQRLWVHEGLILKREQRIATLSVISIATEIQFDQAYTQDDFMVPEINWK